MSNKSAKFSELKFGDIFVYNKRKYRKADTGGAQQIDDAGYIFKAKWLFIPENTIIEKVIK